jgi:hypothetical protein
MLQYSVAMFKKKATTFRNAFSTGRRRRAAFAAESVVFATRTQKTIAKIETRVLHGY